MTITPRTAIRIVAGLGLAQAVISGALLLAIEKATSDTENKARFLIDIVERNVEHLEPFDIIAMQELGIIREVVDAS